MTAGTTTPPRTLISPVSLRTRRGRVGYALNNVLFYGTGGLAFGELRATTFGLT